MDKYELLTKVVPDVIIINDINMPLKLHGLYHDDSIYISGNLDYKERIATLAEEIGHYFTSVGNIVNYKIYRILNRNLRLEDLDMS